MRVQLIGTGSALTSHMSACAMIDGRILIDCPNGSVKAMRRQGITPIDIDVCLITHFHADHYFDIPFLLLEHGTCPERQKKFTVIGPRHLMEHIEKLFELAYPEDWKMVIRQSMLKTIEVSEKQMTIYIDGYEIVPYKVDHSVCDAFGYTISDKKQTVGFTGDSALCYNIEKIIQTSGVTFADMSFLQGTKTHMGMDDIVYLTEKYSGDTKIIPTHMGDDVRAAFKELFSFVPSDGDIFYV